MIDKLGPGAVILSIKIWYTINLSITFHRQFLQELCVSLHEVSSLPLWIGIDQEGGLVNRLKPVYGFADTSHAYLVIKMI